MRKKMLSAQVHRFRDDVALNVGTGATVYISATDAERLAEALLRVAASCQTEKFTESTCATSRFDFAGAEG